MTDRPAWVDQALEGPTPSIIRTWPPRVATNEARRARAHRDRHALLAAENAQEAQRWDGIVKRIESIHPTAKDPR